MAKKLFLDEHKDDIINCFNDGMMYVDIAAEFNTTGPTVKKALQRWGIDISSRSRCFKTARTYSNYFGLVRKLYQSGQSTRQIAKRLGFPCHTTTVAILQHLGIELRADNKTKGITQRQVIKYLRRKKVNDTIIADVLNLTPGRVKTLVSA
jgi:hypothetical protein